MCFRDVLTNTGVRRGKIFSFMAVLSYFRRESDTLGTTYRHAMSVGIMPQKVLGLLDIMYYISILL
jgi:hypothetical protein